MPLLTALSCDNLSHNGATLKRVLARFAALRDGAAATIARFGAST